MRRVLIVIGFLLLLGLLDPSRCALFAEGKSTEGTYPIDDRFVLGGTGERIDAWLKELVPAGFSGSVIVYKDGLILLHEAYGEADRERRLATTVETRFPLGSMESELLLAAASRLAMDGGLTIDDPLRRTIDLVRDGPEDAEAARHLTEVLEEASGRPIRSLIRERVLDKTGMTHTIFSSDPGFAGAPRGRAYTAHARAFRLLEKSPWLLPLLRPSLRRAAEKLRPAHGEETEGSGSPGIWSTTGDLFRWRLAIQGGSWTDVETAARLREGAPGERRLDAVLPGRQLAILSDPARHLILIVAVNNDLGWAGPALYGIERRLRGGADALLTFTILAICVAALFLALGVVPRGKRGSFGRRGRPNPFPF